MLSWGLGSLWFRGVVPTEVRAGPAAGGAAADAEGDVGGRVEVREQRVVLEDTARFPSMSWDVQVACRVEPLLAAVIDTARQGAVQAGEAAQ